MNVTDQLVNAHQKPLLIHLTKYHNGGKENRSPPKLLRIPLDTLAPKQPNLERIPFQPKQSYRTELVEHKHRQRIVPKLIDLKPILKMNMDMPLKQPEKEFKVSAPKLIRLPRMPFETTLLQSPKRQASPKRRPLKSPEKPELVDIRPATQPQTTQLITLTELQHYSDKRLIRTPDLPKALK